VYRNKKEKKKGMIEKSMPIRFYFFIFIISNRQISLKE